MFKGLSAEQAPPITVPFRFFLTAPLFAILISVVLCFYPIEDVFNRYSMVSVGIIHLFTLGILAQIIVGALQQMLPVLAGVVFKQPIIFANIIHTTLTIGTLCLSGGFILSLDILLTLGMLFLSISFGSFFFVLIKLLFQVKYITSTVNAMRWFSLGGAITVIFGLFLLYSHISLNIQPFHYLIVNIHILFAAFGFVIILIMGVAYQVVPMFYVAQDFPKHIQNRFAQVIFGMLCLSIIYILFKLEWSLIKFIISGFVIIFAYYALVSLNNRKRPVFDVTLWYWKFSLSFLIVSQILFLFFSNDILLFIVFIFGFIYPLLQGMIYKIIPFLSWFHLNSKGYFMIPNLREYIKEDMIKIQFYIYVGSFLFFIMSTFFNQLFLYIAAILFAVSNVLFLYNLLTAVIKYKNIVKLSPMESMKMMSK